MDVFRGCNIIHIHFQKYSEATPTTLNDELLEVEQNKTEVKYSWMSS